MSIFRNLSAVVTAAILGVGSLVAKGMKTPETCVVVEGARDRHAQASAIVREVASELGATVTETSASGEVIHGNAPEIELRILAPYEYHAAVIQALGGSSSSSETSMLMATLDAALRAERFSLGSCEDILSSLPLRELTDERRGG